MSFSNNDMLLEAYIFETIQLLEDIEGILLQVEKEGMTEGHINDIFRSMHTMKGSAGMMDFQSISRVSHAVEDLFSYVREVKLFDYDFSDICDLVLLATDFVKSELEKIQGGMTPPDGDPDDLIAAVKRALEFMKTGSTGYKEPVAAKEKQPAAETVSSTVINTAKVKTEGDDPSVDRYVVTIFFEDNCMMEHIRAFAAVHVMKEICEFYYHIPQELTPAGDSTYICHDIIQNGFRMYFETKASFDIVSATVGDVQMIKTYELIPVKRNILVEEEIEEEEEEEEEDDEIEFETEYKANNTALNNLPNKGKAKAEGTMAPAGDLKALSQNTQSLNTKQSIISVNVSKLDKLMDMVGELVIAEAMVTRSPEIEGLELPGFDKAARQLRKLTSELQDVVMSVRMLPIEKTFGKMKRIVRDMAKKLDKEVNLVLVGEDTEVDKNIIDGLGDPLMHMIRNSMDHGLESPEERDMLGKPRIGTITLEARNSGGEVLITVTDDGRGLNREKILAKAREKGLITKTDAEMTDKDVHQLILLPGFSTKEEVSEFSGRGVGMDVVRQSLEKIGGTLVVESKQGVGTKMMIKIPLTLAIIEGMIVALGDSIFTIPLTSIVGSFKPEEDEIILDNKHNEMIMVRGTVYPIVRLHKLFEVEQNAQTFEDGILMLVESNSGMACLFIDRLVGRQQIVVKPLPKYVTNMIPKGFGIVGCTILGDGNISLILDITGVIDK